VLALIALLLQLMVPMLAFPAGALAQDEEAATPSAPVDTTAPVVSVPAGITVTADAATGTAIVTFDVSASDDVDGPVAAACDWASGAAFPAGATTVTCTATDSAGNAGSGSFVVTVNPAPEPEPTQAPEPPATQAPEPAATEAPAPAATLRPVTGPPAITSDKEDYAPGERVTLTGTN
jgi:hypothetical protein